MRAFIFACLAACSLSACGSLVSATDITPESDALRESKPNPALQHNIAVNQTGRTEQAAMKTESFNKEFYAALSSSLQTAGLAAPALSGQYTLDASLLRCMATSQGKQMTCHVEYTLTRRADRAVLYHETLQTDGSSGYEDAWYFGGDGFNKISMSQAMKANIRQLVGALNALPVR